MNLSTLKEAAGCGLCVGENIGEMMSREFRRGEEEPIELEVLCMEARRMGFHRQRTGGKRLGFADEGDEGEGSLLKKEDGRGVQDSIILI
ncbi:hypothetical protein L6452_19222 [Arctium lappa]|uniref:Uncharacterized protein n=1 Tax=Arctium lappa TaxID=4217 RepID=A0ACB9B839_ARCLA|nr:hypothetical protein L6452_19222 [Arctium lappa]